MASDLEFGQRVEWQRPLIRRRAPAAHRGDLKTWEPDDLTAYGRPNEWKPGIVIGRRSLSNGETNWGYPDEGGSTFKATGRVSAYLVAVDMRRRPVLVLPEDVREARDD